MAKAASARLQQEAVFRDARPFLTRVFMLLQSRRAFWVHAGLGVVAIVPMLGPLSLLLSLFAYLIFRSRTVVLPMQIPRYSPYQKDPNNPRPKDGKAGRPEGISYHGVAEDIEPGQSGVELWTSRTVDTTHRMYLATTGGGKTAAMTSQLVNTFLAGSGCIYTDGKAQLDVPIRVASLAHRFGRLPDFAVVSFMRGGMSPWETSDKKITHSISLVHGSSATMLAEALDGMLQVENDMWGSRARLLQRANAYLIKYLTETGQAQGTIQELLDLLDLQLATAWAYDPNTPRAAAGLLEAYIRNLPEVTEPMIAQLRTGTIPAEVARQHGFLTMQLIPMLAPMVMEYGDILSPPEPDVDMEDTIINNRIVMFLLPALEKSSESVSSLGRTIVSLVKGMMAKSILTDLEGDVADNLDRLATNADAAYVFCWDEVGYYMTPDHAVKAAQGRSLTISEWYGTQDIAAMKKDGDKAVRATQSIIGNTGLKWVGRIEDTDETLPMLQRRADKVHYTEQSSLNRDVGSSGYYSQGVSIVHRERLTMNMLAGLHTGESLFIWENNLIKARQFYAEVDRISHFRMNRLAPRPSPRALGADPVVVARKHIGARLGRLADPHVQLPNVAANEELDALLGVVSDGHEDVIEYIKGTCQQRIKELEDILMIGPVTMGSGEEQGAVGEQTDDGDEAGGWSTADASLPGPHVGSGENVYPDSPEGSGVEEDSPLPARFRPMLDMLFASLDQTEGEFVSALQALEGQQGDEARGSTSQRVQADMRVIAEALAYPRAPYPKRDPQATAALARSLLARIRGTNSERPS